jgi:hypothetical protein
MYKKLFGIGVILIFSVVTPVFAGYQVAPNQQAGDAIPPTVYVSADAQRQARCTSCTYTTYRLVRQLNCGGTVAIEGPLGEKPKCKIIPRVTDIGAVELEWDTAQAEVAFIDNGVGHVTLGTGARVITPHKDTTYNMTVINAKGLVGVCSARVEVSNAPEEHVYVPKPGDRPVPTLEVGQDQDVATSTDGEEEQGEGFWAWLFSVAHRVWLVAAVVIGVIIFVIYHTIAWIVRQVRQ